MFRQEMPRVKELQDLIGDQSASSSYFQNFDNLVRDEPEIKKTWLARERVFQRLDLESWNFLKSEANPYLTKPSMKDRGYQQLISILNQAWAYIYLIDAGYLRVGFIPPLGKGRETPDLEGELREHKVLCEVKTISISQVEAERRRNGGGVETVDLLEVSFLDKLSSTLCKAKSQLESYDNSENTRHIAFIILNFDAFLGEYKANYFQQIDRYLTDNPFVGIDIVFYNQRTAFNFPISMDNATVVNESG